MQDMEKLNDQEMADVVGGISGDQALEASLKHAGLRKDQLDFVKKCELDYEHGRKVYEISFYQGGYEYEYEVDAATGRILKCEKDWD